MTSVSIAELLKDYEEQSELFALEGEHAVEITSAKPGSASGLAARCQFKVLEGPLTGKRAMTDFGTFNGKGGGILVQNLVGAGLTKEWLGQFGTAEAAIQPVCDALKGRKIRATFKVEDYQGTDRTKLVPGSVKLVEAPPLPAVGGVPAAAVAAPVAAPPVAAPAPVAAVAAPVAPAPVAAPVAPAPPVAPVVEQVAAPVAAPVAPQPVQPVAEGVVVSQEPGF